MPSKTVALHNHETHCSCGTLTGMMTNCACGKPDLEPLTVPDSCFACKGDNPLFNPKPQYAPEVGAAWVRWVELTHSLLKERNIVQEAWESLTESERGALEAIVPEDDEIGWFYVVPPLASAMWAETHSLLGLPKEPLVMREPWEEDEVS